VKACLSPLLASLIFESSCGKVSTSAGKEQLRHLSETFECCLSLLILAAFIQCGFDIDRQFEAEKLTDRL
jgi:hypothetical protein